MSWRHLRRRIMIPLTLSHVHLSSFFFLNDTAPPEISPLPLHDALPLPRRARGGLAVHGPPRGAARRRRGQALAIEPCRDAPAADRHAGEPAPPPLRLARRDLHEDRKSTRLNSSH